MFAESIFFDDGSLPKLLTSTTTWLNEPLAALYGASGVTGLGFQRTAVDGATRAGLLTQASILSLTSDANESSPAWRGVFIDRKLLCLEIPPPPTGLAELPPAMAGQTNRQRYEMAIGAGPQCVACHTYIEGVGFGLEHFDAIGRYRETDNQQPIDATGAVRVPDGQMTRFNGAVDLSAKLAASTAVRDCVAKQWFRFALSRDETEDDACSLRAIQDVFRRSANMQDLVVAIATSRPFRYARW
jgi:hypothetical protein